MDKTKTFDKGRSLSRLARARRNASGRAVTLTLTRIRTKREREGTREDHIDNGDGRETRHWASCVSSPSGSCAAKQGLVGKRVTDMTRIPHCPPLGPRTRSWPTTGGRASFEDYPGQRCTTIPAANFFLSLREFSELMYVNNDSKDRLHKGLLLRMLKRSEL